jgi:hypothetical protein
MRTTWRYIPEHSALHNHRCKNLKSYTDERRFEDIAQANSVSGNTTTDKEMGSV